MPTRPTKPSPKNKRNGFLRFSGMAVQMVIPILAGVWGGIKLDAMNSLKFPIWTILLALGGVALALYLVIKETAKP